mmetsp:Transcript_3745/g.14703  ORF Transcript_3745/g.14703 Transcript_3745/m.14703 type:complete len:391 (+) Transcript_3745:879-2051(+)
MSVKHKCVCKESMYDKTARASQNEGSHESASVNVRDPNTKSRWRKENNAERSSRIDPARSLVRTLFLDEGHGVAVDEVEGHVLDVAHAAEVEHRLARRGVLPVVVDDDPAALDLIVQQLERVHRGAVHVAIEPEERDRVDRRRRQRLVEDALEQDDAVGVPEVVALEGGAHGVGAADVEVLERPAVGVDGGRVGRRGAREAAERVGDDDASRAAGLEDVEDAFGEDRRAAPPGAALDEVAADAVAHEALDHGVDPVELVDADHRVARPARRERARGAGVVALRRVEVEPPGDGVAQDAHEPRGVGRGRRVVGCLERRRERRRGDEGRLVALADRRVRVRRLEAHGESVRALGVGETLEHGGVRPVEARLGRARRRRMCCDARRLGAGNSC